MAGFLTINLNARLQPMHRHQLEDDFDAYCQANNFAIQTAGGGTAMSDEGEIVACNIELSSSTGQNISDNELQSIQDYFHQIAPKGSHLTIYQNDTMPNKIAIGTKEGLALHLNGTDLDDEIYQNSDINIVVDECNALLGDLGALESYWEGKDTALYFYGDDFLAMKQAIEPFLQQYPLCQQCRIEQIA